MKRYISILTIMLFVLSANGQGKQEVISSAGGYNSNNGLSISWTLGETIIPTFKSQDGSMVLTHGFQQQLVITTVAENLDVHVNIKVYPNPVSDMVNIQFASPVDQEVVLVILDSQGRVVKNDFIEVNASDKSLNLQYLAGGIYYIRLTKGKLINVYKVVKL